MGIHDYAVNLLTNLRDERDSESAVRHLSLSDALEEDSNRTIQVYCSDSIYLP